MLPIASCVGAALTTVAWTKLSIVSGVGTISSTLSWIALAIASTFVPRLRTESINGDTSTAAAWIDSTRGDKFTFAELIALSTGVKSGSFTA